ncbi:hypothetical protein G7046_g3044 [Stylonectria norvegica]|nr:hypothetical protein G7046_g3044 [Stylonectria norvegica]
MSETEQPSPPSGDGTNDEQRGTDGTNSNDALRETPRNPYFADATQAGAAGRKLPPWLDHFNAKDLKKLFRCCLAVWLMTLLILINPTLRVLGQATFLGICLWLTRPSIVLFIAPPSGILFIHLFSAITILLGLTSGWAWGVITMKAALAARPAAETKARYGALLQMAQSQNTTSPTLYVQTQIYNGYMLDTRVTLVYFGMMGVFLYLMARLRVAAPKLLLVQIMACIVSTVFLTQAPLLPTFMGTIGKLFVLPVVVAEGIAIVCSIVIFPTSSSSEALDAMRGLLAPMPSFLDACLLGLQNPSARMSIATLGGTRLKVLMIYKQLDAFNKFLPIDFSLGRWSSDDFASLNGPLRRLMIAFTGLLDIHRQNEVGKNRVQQHKDLAQSTEDGAISGPGKHQIQRALDFHGSLNHSQGTEMKMKSLKALSIPAATLISACDESIEAVSEAMLHCNALKRTAGQEEMVQRHYTALENLREHRKTFMSSTSHYVSQPSHKLLDDQGLLGPNVETAPSLAGLMLGLLIKERLSQLADALELLLSQVIELEETRPTIRFWMPRRLMSLFGWISDPDSSENDIPSTDMGDTGITRMTTVTSTYTRLPPDSDDETNGRSARAELVSMRTPNSRKRNRLGQTLLNITRWFSSAAGTYGLRIVVVSLALATPGVVRSSAGFYYREKGMWAVIMAQLCLVPYSADLVNGIIARAVGTVVGGVLGMAAWYIGAGNGPGNPYGVAAIMAVVIVMFMWWRLFSSPQWMAAGLMMAATAYLVVAYSWIDTHNPTYGNPGVGYEVFWRRVVLVFVGFVGALIVNYLPKPPSANRHYRHILADSLASIRDRYALFATNFKDPAPDLRELAEEEALAIGEVLSSISGPIKLTVLEFSSSNIDSSTLGQVCQLCIVLNQAVTQLLIYTTRLSEEQRAWVVPSTGAVREQLIADFMAVISLAQQALKSGDPLPAVLPTPLFAKTILAAKEQIRTGTLGFDHLYRTENFDDEGSRRYMVILNALLQMLATLDELVLVLKRAVGETSNIAVLEAV